jgi:hypothetical protein
LDFCLGVGSIEKMVKDACADDDDDVCKEEVACEVACCEEDSCEVACCCEDGLPDEPQQHTKLWRPNTIRAVVLLGSVGLIIVASTTLVHVLHRRHHTTSHATLPPQSDPYAVPTMSPMGNPTVAAPTLVTYVPGELGETRNGMMLSTGLNATLLASTGYRVRYNGGNKSDILFHRYPDFGATFVDSRSWNEGGWIYVSNSEVKEEQGGLYQGGVGALTFDRHGNVVDYKMILEGTTANCGGGRTPWGSWISCEEHSLPITLGRNGGHFESFAYDERKSHYFVTEDDAFGPLRRFIPTYSGNTDPWEDLFSEGAIAYLRLIPDSDYGGTFVWLEDFTQASMNANAFYPNAEGVDVAGDELYFVSKTIETLFILKLDEGVYTSQSTRVRLVFSSDVKVSSMDHLHSSNQ